jgi:hypothetical protein
MRDTQRASSATAAGGDVADFDFMMRDLSKRYKFSSVPRVINAIFEEHRGNNASPSTAANSLTPAINATNVAETPASIARYVN